MKVGEWKLDDERTAKGPDGRFLQAVFKSGEGLSVYLMQNGHIRVKGMYKSKLGRLCSQTFSAGADSEFYLTDEDVLFSSRTDRENRSEEERDMTIEDSTERFQHQLKNLMSGFSENNEVDATVFINPLITALVVAYDAASEEGAKKGKTPQSVESYAEAVKLSIIEAYNQEPEA